MKCRTSFILLKSICLWLCWVFVAVRASGGYSLVAMCGLLIVVASLVEHRL